MRKQILSLFIALFTCLPSARVLCQSATGSLKGYGLAGVPDWSALEGQFFWYPIDSSGVQIQCRGAWLGGAGRGDVGAELRVGLDLAPGWHLWSGFGRRAWRGGIVSLGGSWESSPPVFADLPPSSPFVKGHSSERSLAFHIVLPLRSAASDVVRTQQTEWQVFYEVQLPGSWRGLMGLSSNFGRLSPTMGLAKTDKSSRRAQIQWRGPWRGWLLRWSAPVKSLGSLSISWAIQSAAPSRWGWTAAHGRLHWSDAWDGSL